jgi:hypothetical protein
MCDPVNHTRFPKEDHLPDWVCRDKHGNKGDRVEYDASRLIAHGELMVSTMHRGRYWRVKDSNNK